MDRNALASLAVCANRLATVCAGRPYLTPLISGCRSGSPRWSSRLQFLLHRRTLLAVSALLVAAQISGWRPARASDHVSVTEVASGIFVHQGVHEQMSPANLGAIGNSGFIVGDQSVAIIDPGGSPEFGKQLFDAVRRVTDLPVDYVILTHFHPDHVAGATSFPKSAIVIAHANYTRALAQRAQFYLDRFTELLAGSIQDVFRLPDREIEIGQTLEIDLGGRRLSVEAYELAHTDNDITIHDLKTNTFWVSDLVFAQRTPSLDGSLNGWLDVLSKLDQRQYALTIPGHGTPALWTDLVASQRSYLTRLHDDVAEFLEQGLALSEVLERHDKNENDHPSWFLYAEQHGSNLAKTYSELEWQ